MAMKRVIVKCNKGTLIVLVLVAILLAKIVQLFLLPEKYFYDAQSVMTLLENGFISGYPLNFWIAAQFFKPLYVIGFHTMESMIMILSIVCNIFMIFFIYKHVYLNDLFNLTITILYMMMINIYIFMPMKEFIQFLLMMLYFYIFKSKRKTLNSKRKKSCAILFVTVLIGIMFREYYLLIAAIFVCLLLFFKRLKNDNLLVNIKHLLLLFSGVVATLYLSRIIVPNMYERLASLKYNLTYFRVGSSSANTLILDKFENSNPLYFTINIVINVFRLLFPIELLFVSFNPLYMMTIVVQALLFLYLMRLRKKAEQSETHKMLYYFFLAFIFVSAIFEPDYGSVMRHFSALYPIIVIGMERPRVVKTLNI